MAIAAAIEGGVDVESAAGDHEPVDQGQVMVGEVGLVRQGDRQAAGSGHHIAIILPQRVPGQLGVAAGRLAVERHADDGSSCRAVHIAQR